MGRNVDFSIWPWNKTSMHALEDIDFTKDQKTRMSKSKLKVMRIVFFDIKGVIMIKWVPQGQTVNQKYYIEVLTKLREWVRKRRPDLWENNSWLLHQDNAPAHNAISVRQFLANKRITVLEHSPYFLDLAPCDFYLFPKVKSALKGTHFKSVGQGKTADLLKKVTLEDLQHCFGQWKIRMQRCIDREGEYVEGDLTAFCNKFSINHIFQTSLVI